jgi:hypothetical protein
MYKPIDTSYYDSQEYEPTIKGEQALVISNSRKEKDKKQKKEVGQQIKIEKICNTTTTSKSPKRVRTKKNIQSGIDLFTYYDIIEEVKKQ